MTIAKPKRRSRLLKRLLIAVAIVAALIFGLHLWFVHNAKSILKDYISSQSGGKIKLDLSELDLNLITNRLLIHEVDLLSTDSLNEAVTYHVKFNKLSVKVASLWSLLVDNKLLLDSIKLYDPVVEVMHWRKDTTQKRDQEDLSIPQEVGKMYQSLLNALDEFGVRRILIDNAKISLVNKMVKDAEPVTVSNIFLDLLRTPVHEGKKVVYYAKDNKVEVRSTSQNIALPGGRHRLSFKSFKLGLFRERIDLDSCTITATPTDSLKSNYKIFFKKLSLTGVDFSAMSSMNLIKADSVYCEEPLFDFNLYKSDAVKRKAKTKKPDPDQIIRELTGNLNLAFVGVKNAGIHFDIYGATKRSFSNSNKDNFEMKGFRINPDSTEPVSIRSFDMTLRDYSLYNEDSSSVTSFDSLHFLNSKIVLNNFAVFSKPGRNKLLNDIDIRVPYFELTDLDWYAVIFDQYLMASSAVLNNPIVNYTRRKPRKTGAKKGNIFNALQSLDDQVSLDNVAVYNGQVNMNLGPATSINVQDVNLKIHSSNVLESTTTAGLRSAVEQLSFTKGLLRLKDITARLDDVRYTGKNLIYADKVAVSSASNKISASIDKVNIDNMQLDDKGETIDLDGLRWNSAVISIHGAAAGKKGKKASTGSLHLRNLAGRNTKINYSAGNTSIFTNVQTLNAASLLKKGSKPVRIEGFNVTGNDLAVKSTGLQVNADAYKLDGAAASSITGLRVQQIKGHDSMDISSSQLNFFTDLNELLNNDFHLSNVQARELVVNMRKWDTAKAANKSHDDKSIRIDQFLATEPDLHIALHKNDSVTNIDISRAEKGILQFAGLLISGEGIKLASLKMNSGSATFQKPNGEILGVKNGNLNLDVANIYYGKKAGKTSWSALINNIALEDAGGLNMGSRSKNLKFNNAYVGNLVLSSEYLPDVASLLRANLTAWLKIPYGQFVDSNTSLYWYNANYSNTNRSLSLDSFTYFPTKSLDSVLAHAPYELDYITMKTGPVQITGFDVSRYENDSSFKAGTIKISDPYLTVYRDKLPPSSPHRKEKPLPADLLKRLKLPVSVKAIEFDNGTITYTERNEKSREEGNVLLTNVHGSLSNIKNRNLQPDDSLQLLFNARLMDNVDFNVVLKESYADTLNGFLLTAKTKSTALNILNPVVVPLSNVKITAGFLDSLSFTAVGRKDVAVGQMNMNYHDLKIKLIKAGDSTHSTFLQNVLSFVANAFVVKNDNAKRTGVIYYNRSEDQSFVNYIVKMTLSGMGSSVLGEKKNRKMVKQYKKELKASGLPEIQNYVK